MTLLFVTLKSDEILSMSMLLSLVSMHCVFSSIEDSSNNITCEITVYMLTVFFNS